jgi:hypothetical protein
LNSDPQADLRPLFPFYYHLALLLLQA